MIDPSILRKDFPILNQKINNSELIYLDNAATSQKPQIVIDSIVEYYSKINSNVHRGVHTLSQIATQQYEDARIKTQKFLNARYPKEIIWTKNDTEAINLLAYSLGSKLSKGDSIILSETEHHSNIVPWQILSQKIGFTIKYLKMSSDGTLSVSQLEDLIDEHVKIVSFVHVSNALGIINDVQKMILIIRGKSKAYIIVDGAQSAPHMPINVQQMDCDFFVMSAHKMCGPTGVGVLYGKEEILQQMDPFLAGGDMIKEVSINGSTFADLPYKFEAGTPNIEGVIAFGVAIDYLHNIGMGNIEEYEKELTTYAFDKLQPLEEKGDLIIYGTKDITKRSGIITFNLLNIHSHDVGTLLDEQGIAIRTGHHCAQPVIKSLNVSSTARVSFYFYNTKEEIDIFVKALQNVLDTFK